MSQTSRQIPVSNGGPSPRKLSHEKATTFDSPSSCSATITPQVGKSLHSARLPPITSRVVGSSNDGLALSATVANVQSRLTFQRMHHETRTGHHQQTEHQGSHVLCEVKAHANNRRRSTTAARRRDSLRDSKSRGTTTTTRYCMDHLFLLPHDVSSLVLLLGNTRKAWKHSKLQHENKRKTQQS